MMRCNISLLALFSLLVLPGVAHEGHHAITTKGVEIDDRGLLHLEARARKAIGLSSELVDFGVIEQRLELNTRIVLPLDANAYAGCRLEGMVHSILVTLGQRVKAGDPLAIVESLALEVLQLDLERAEIALELAETNLVRTRKLDKTMIAASKNFALQAELDTRRNRVAHLTHKLRMVGELDPQGLVVRAPIDGHVASIEGVIGQHVTPADHLFEIQDLDQVWAECDVPEKLLAQLNTGKKTQLSFSAYPDRIFEGETVRKSLRVDPKKKQGRLWIALENTEQRLFPGMFGSARVVTARTDEVFVAPGAAIVVEGAEHYAFVQQEEGVYRKTNVVLGMAMGGQVEIVDGLFPGDAVVVKGSHQLSSLFVQETFNLSDEARRNIGFASQQAGLQQVEQTRVVNGRVVSPPHRQGIAAAHAEGVIGRIAVTPGQRVEEGQLLAWVESFELMDIQLELLQLHRQLTLLQAQRDALTPLAEKGIVGRKEMAVLHADLAALAAELLGPRRKLLVMGLSKAEIEKVLQTGKPVTGFPVRSPLGGHITEIYGVVGKAVRHGDHLFQIFDPDEVWIEGAFFESAAAALFDGQFSQSVLVRGVAYPNRVWQGTLSFATRVFDSESKTLAAWVVLANDDGALMPGMQATLDVRFGSPEEKVLAIPVTGLYGLGRKHFAFVQLENGFRRVEVVPGRRDTDWVEIVSGLQVGDQIVVSGVVGMNNAFSVIR